MEQLDTDIDYGTTPRPANPGSRFNLLLAFPIIGILLMLFFITAAIFQFDISGIVDSLVGLLLFLFFAVIAGIFWAMYPRVRHDYE